jgi:hypothetical protein
VNRATSSTYDRDAAELSRLLLSRRERPPVITTRSTSSCFPRALSVALLAIALVLPLQVFTAPSPADAAAKSFSNSSAPTITGTAKVGAKLTAKATAWTPSRKTTTYQWIRNGKAISGAKATTYTVTSADVNAVITVAVTGTASGYTTTTKVSKSTAMVAYKNCTALNQKFPHGVGKKGATDKVPAGAKPVTGFTVNSSIYTANAASDRDKDGIACEKK